MVVVDLLGDLLLKVIIFIYDGEKNYFRKLIVLLCIFILFFCCWIDVKMLLKKLYYLSVFLLYVYCKVYRIFSI